MLDFCTVRLFDLLVWLILRYHRWVMLEPLYCLLNIQWHQKVYLLAGIVPFDGESAVTFSFHFKQAYKVFRHRLYQVLGVFFPNLFYPKVFNNERKGDGMPFMCPQPWRCFALVIAVLLQPFCQELLGDYPRLWEPVHALADFAVDVPVGCRNVEQVVMCNGIFWHVGEFQSHVLIPSHGRA
jgi:hypothetical protein